MTVGRIIQLTTTPGHFPKARRKRKMSGHADKVIMTVSIIDGRGVNQPVRQLVEDMPLGRKLDANLMDWILKEGLDMLTGRTADPRSPSTRE